MPQWIKYSNIANNIDENLQGYSQKYIFPNCVETKYIISSNMYEIERFNAVGQAKVWNGKIR